MTRVLFVKREDPARRSEKPGSKHHENPSLHKAQDDCKIEKEHSSAARNRGALAWIARQEGDIDRKSVV